MKYAIHICPGHLDLIEHLNGVRPEIEEEKTYYVVTLPDPNDEHHADIKSEDDLYENGYLKEEMIVIP